MRFLSPDHLQFSSYLSLTGLLTAIRGLNICSHLYLRVLSPPGPCQALTINYNNQTIWILKLSLFSQFNSSQSPGLPQLTRHWIQVFLLKKDLPKPCTPPSPPGSSCREFSPPLRPPAGLQFGKVVGGPPFFYPSIPSPPPVLHSIHSHATHLAPPIHQNCPLKVFDVHSFCHLSVQAACVDTRHLH